MSKYFCLINEKGDYLTYNPVSDAYKPVESETDLQIWDYQETDDEMFWFSSASEPSYYRFKEVDFANH